MTQISCISSRRMLVAGSAFACGVASVSLSAQTLDVITVSPASASAVSKLTDKSCILAGRLSADSRWAPLARGVTLLNAQGNRVSASSKKALDTVTAVQLGEPALLSLCNGSQPLVSGESATGSKTPAPAIEPGPIALHVEAIYYPPMRAGGQWVELQLVVPADRMITVVR